MKIVNGRRTYTIDGFIFVVILLNLLSGLYLTLLACAKQSTTAHVGAIIVMATAVACAALERFVFQPRIQLEFDRLDAEELAQREYDSRTFLDTQRRIARETQRRIARERERYFATSSIPVPSEPDNTVA